MLIVQLDGRIVFASQCACTLLGYPTVHELLSCRIEDLVPERFRDAHVGHRLRFSAQKRSRPIDGAVELLARRRDGSELPVEISLSSVVYQGETLTITTLRDVTARKRIQNELLRERRAADEARQIAESACETAQRANQAKSRFLSTASHDLRQPLQSLALLNGALRRLAGEQIAQEALAQQEQAIESMSRLLNALLDISKLESGAIKPEITDFNVAGLFEELRVEFGNLAVNRGLALEVHSCEATVRTDASLLGQILRNLVSNAIHYTHRGRVILRGLALPGKVRLEVADTGIGIHADHIPHIFDEFYQVEGNRGGKRHGYGLGLSIVSRITKLLDLKLEVHSKPGEGSCFQLNVPVGAADPVYGPAPGSSVEMDEPRAPNGSLRVLLVEDDAGVRAATYLLLKTAGYEVVPAASCAEALECLKTQQPIHILITDFHLGPECTGADIIYSLRQELGLTLPAILMSGDTSTALRRLAHDAQLNIVSKPIQADQLLALMLKLLER